MKGTESPVDQKKVEEEKRKQEQELQRQVILLLNFFLSIRIVGREKSSRRTSKKGRRKVKNQIFKIKFY